MDHNPQGRKADQKQRQPRRPAFAQDQCQKRGAGGGAKIAKLRDGPCPARAILGDGSDLLITILVAAAIFAAVGPGGVL